MKIKKLIYLFDIDTVPDPSNDIVDVLIELEDDKYCTNNFTYVLEVATPQALADLMKKDGVHHLPPDPLFVIVDEISHKVIKEAILEFVADKEDAYWLKLYHLADILNIDYLNTEMDKLKKSIEE